MRPVPVEIVFTEGRGKGEEKDVGGNGRETAFSSNMQAEANEQTRIVITGVISREGVSGREGNIQRVIGL